MFSKLQELRDIHDDDLENKHVVYHDNIHKYAVFNNIQEVTNYIDEGNIHLHEVTFGHYHQKLKFDIDAKIHELQEINNDNIDFPECITSEGVSKTVKYVVYKVIEKVFEVFTELYYEFDFFLSLDDILLTSSCGKDKKSYHIIINNFSVANNQEAKYFAEKVIERLPKECIKFIDNSVYKSTQNFRLFGCAKSGETPRIKQKSKFSDVLQISTDFTFEDTLIQKTNNTQLLPKLLKPVVEVIKNDMDEFDDKFVKETIKKQKYLDNFTLRNKYKNSYYFNRVKPSYCNICKEIHHNDNSLILHLNKTPQAMYINEQCRQNSSKNMLLVDKLTYDTMTNSQKIKDLLSKTYNPITTEFDKVTDKYSYSEDHMHSYDLKPTQCVSAQMKLGKTKALRNYLDTHFKGNKNIIFITFRKTFSASVLKTFSEFKMYDTFKGTISARETPKVIVQVESLHRIEASDVAPDLIILDEVESIFDQFNSGLHKFFVKTCSIFQYLLSYSKNVICMDANLSDRTYNILRTMRPQHPISLHENTFKKAANDRYFITYSINDWLGNVIRDLDNNKKIVIPINSLTDAKMLHKIITSRYPHKSIRLYSSETPQSEKKLHFSDVDKYWSVDVLIYTPTCSAGVSFEKKHFDSLHAYFTDSSCNVEASRQMLGRVRNLNSGKHNILFVKSGLHGYVPTTISEIEKEITNRRSCLFTEMSSVNIPFEYDDKGEIIFYKSKYYYMFLHNLQFNNLSKAFYVNRFIHQIINSGATVSELTVKEKYVEVAKLLLEEKNTMKSEIVEEKNQAIAESPDISTAECDKISEKISFGEATQEDVHAMQKFKLRQFYGWINTMTAEFINKYSDEKVKKLFINLKDICRGESYLHSLEQIKETEQMKHQLMYTAKKYTSAEMAEIPDIQIDKVGYTYNSHNLIYQILNLMGFNTIFNPEKLLTGTLMTNIMRNKDEIDFISDDIKLEFRCSTIKVAPLITKFGKDNEQQIMKKFITNFNNVLEKQYGFKFVIVEFQIDIIPSQSKLFDIGEETLGQLPFISCNFYNNRGT